MEKVAEDRESVDGERVERRREKEEPSVRREEGKEMEIQKV